MTENLKAGDKCLECAEAGLDHKLRYFYINLEEQILKCEHRTCLWPHNDEVSSDEEESIVDDEYDDDFIRNLLQSAMDNSETVDDTVLQTTTNSIPMEEQQALNIEPEILKVTDLVPSAIESNCNVQSTDLNCYPRLPDLKGTAVGPATTQQCDPESYSPMTAVLPSLPDLTDLFCDYNPIVQLESTTAAKTAMQSLEEPSKDGTSTVATAITSQLNDEEPSIEETDTTITATQLNEVVPPVKQSTIETSEPNISSMPTITFDFSDMQAIIDEPPKEGTGTTIMTQCNEVIPTKEQSTKKTSESKISSMPTINFDFNGLQPPNERSGTTIMEQPIKKSLETEISKTPAITFDFSCLQPIIEVDLTKPQHRKQHTKRVIGKTVEKRNATKVNRGRSSVIESDDDDDSIPKADISHYSSPIKEVENLNKNKIVRRRVSSKTVVKKQQFSTSSESFKKLLQMMKISNPK